MLEKRRAIVVYVEGSLSHFLCCCFDLATISGERARDWKFEILELLRYRAVRIVQTHGSYPKSDGISASDIDQTLWESIKRGVFSSS